MSAKAVRPTPQDEPPDEADTVAEARKAERKTNRLRAKGL